MNIRCPGCAKLYAVSDQLAGKIATCKKCGHRFKLTPAADGDTTISPQSSSVLEQPRASAATMHDSQFLSDLEGIQSDPLMSELTAASKVLHTGVPSSKKRFRRRPSIGKFVAIFGGGVLAVVVVIWGISAVSTLVSATNPDKDSDKEVAESNTLEPSRRKKTQPTFEAKKTEVPSKHPNAKPGQESSIEIVEEHPTPDAGDIRQEDDLSRLQGRWQMVGTSAQRGQAFRPLRMMKQPDPSPNYKIFAGNSLQELYSSNRHHGQPNFHTKRFDLDESTNPKQIAIITELETANRKHESVSRGIYKFEGDLLYFLFPGVNKPVPREFSVNTPGDNRTLQVFRRIGDVPSANGSPPPSLVWQPNDSAPVSDDRPDNERIQGEWLAVAESASRDGFFYPKERRLNLNLRDTRYTFSGQILLMSIRTAGGGSSRRVFFELDPSTNPKRFTTHLRYNGDRITPGLPVLERGVYQFKDGRLWLLFAGKDAAHPENFKVNTPDKNRLLCIFERQSD